MVAVLDETDLLRRVRAEFDEMPGMRVTFEQLQRLLGVNEPTCEYVLGRLVRDGYIARERGVYRRSESR